MAKGMVIIDEDRCKGCALCAPVCPPKILEIAQGHFNAKQSRRKQLAGKKTQDFNIDSKKLGNYVPTGKA